MNLTDFLILQAQLICAYTIYLILSNKTKHLNINRFYLTLTPLLLIAFTQIDLLYDNSTRALFQIELPTFIAQSSKTTILASSFQWLWTVYISGVLISTLIFVVQLVRILKQPTIKYLGSNGNVKTYLIENKTDSYSFFNLVYISESQLHEAEYILKHETAHCKQKHTYDILLISILQIVFWCNPILHLWKRKMKENHEYLADKASISCEEEIKAYCHALLSAQIGVSIPNLGNGFNQPSLLRKRIIQLKTKNKIVMKHFILIPAIVGTALLTSSLTIKNSEQLPVQKKEVNGNIDQQPEFPGGIEALFKYIGENMKYPKDLETSKTEGKVIVSFVVSNTGSIEKVKIEQASEHEAFNQEAIRVVKGMPKWNPGMKGGKKVATEMKLPFVFKL